MKKIILMFLFIFGTTFSLTYQSNGKKFSIDDRVIEKTFSRSISNSSMQYYDEIEKEELKLLIFNNLLEQEILLNSSFAKKIIIPKKDIEEQFNLVRNGFPDNISFYKALKSDGFTKITLLKELENDIKLEKVKLAIESQAKVTEEEIKAYYNENEYNSYFINKPYEEIKSDIKESILERKRGEILRYFIESEKEIIIPQKNSSYSKYFSKVVYEKKGFKFTNVDLANKKLMFRNEDLSDEDVLDNIVKTGIDKKLLIVQEAKKLNIKILNTLSKEDKILAYIDGYQKYLIGSIKVSEDELKEYFEENRDRYFIPQIYDIELMELAVVPSNSDKIEAKKKAQEILKFALAGEDFSNLAKQYSEDGSAEDGGNLGWFSKGQMVQSFEDEAFNGKAGKVIPYIVETEFGYHIIKIEDKSTDNFEVNASHILITPKISNETIQETTKKVTELIEKIKTGNTTFENIVKNFSITPDRYDFKNIKKGEYIEGIGTVPLLDEAISSSKINELSYAIGDRAFIFMKTRHNNEIEATFENSLYRVKYDLVREKAGQILNEMFQ